MSTSLRDSLLDALRTLPGKRTFHLHVLTTHPRKHSLLYPFATPRPKCTIQDIVVLCAEERDGQRVFVTAIEASVYLLPASSSGILYIGKVDTTGQGMMPSPTLALVKTLLVYYANPETRPVDVSQLWIQLFARSQNQYLFPNSSEYEGKKPLSDVRLCAWWKRVFTSVADILKTENKLYYILPGYSEAEAIDMVKSPLAPGWTYGHPYSNDTLPGLGKESKGAYNLGNIIPWFEDDPKSRFLDDLACNTERDGVRSPPKKRVKRKHDDDELPSTGSSTPPPPPADEKPSGELGRVTADEFWERLSFRQECVAGAVTGFFTLISMAPSAQKQPQPRGLVSDKVTKRVMTALSTAVEFSTVQRALRATEVVESTIKGLCEGEEGDLGDYSSAIYGGVTVDNPVTSPTEKVQPKEVVRMLTVRKKKKT